MAKLLAPLLLAACATATAPAGPAHAVYVGHSETGEPIFCASHYDAMNGLAVAASGAGGADDLLCSREVLTGTHVPHWICRYASDAALTRERMLDVPKACGFNCTTNDGWAGAIPVGREAVSH